MMQMVSRPGGNVDLVRKLWKFRKLLSLPNMTELADGLESTFL